MNEKLELALSELIGKGLSTAEKAGEFVQAELPDVINQLLIWHGVKSFIYFTICLLLVIILLLAVGKFYLWLMKAEFKGEDDRIGLGAVGIIVFLLCGGPIVGCMLSELTWLQIWLAPKVWLLEYASKLVE